MPGIATQRMFMHTSEHASPKRRIGENVGRLVQGLVAIQNELNSHTAHAHGLNMSVLFAGCGKGVQARCVPGQVAASRQHGGYRGRKMSGRERMGASTVEHKMAERRGQGMGGEGQERNSVGSRGPRQKMP
eukprot:6982017-Lingulodinium_polyedra.AAC.1